MHLSRLTFDTASGRALRALADPYEVHRTIWRGFPDAGDGGPGRVLFRIEEQKSHPSLSVLVQSDLRPDWEPLLEERVLLQAETKKVCEDTLVAALKPGRKLRFLLRANPTERRVFADPAPGEKPTGKRVGVCGEEEQRKWLARKGESGGFRVIQCDVNDRGFQVSRKPGGKQLSHLCVDFAGLLEITDSEAFLQTLEKGLGSAKAFGFGLLSVARI